MYEMHPALSLKARGVTNGQWKSIVNILYWQFSNKTASGKLTILAVL
jgi:hypothetical protein